MTVRDQIRKSEYGGSPNNFHISRKDKELLVELTYPETNKDGVAYIEVDQESVRASDSVRLHYDYDRDGWVVEKPTKLCWNSSDKECDMGWREVAFIQSWLFREEQKKHEDSL